MCCRTWLLFVVVACINVAVVAEDAPAEQALPPGAFAQFKVGDQNGPTNAAFSIDGDRIAISGNNHSRIINLKTGKPTLELPHRMLEGAAPHLEWLVLRGHPLELVNCNVDPPTAFPAVK